MVTKKERITNKAMQILAKARAGIRFSDLVSKLQAAFPDDPYGTITGTVWNLDTRSSDVYKPSRGVFRLTKFKGDSPAQPTEPIAPSIAVKEAQFYQPFAEYLVRDLGECTNAIALGGNRFRSKWGTPDVFGVFRARDSDIVKLPMEIIVAEVKTDTTQLITAFGQACAYKLFAHRSYLVVPRDAQPADADRLDALCAIFGIGLIFFDAFNSMVPDFQIRVRAARHEPDSFYVNENVRMIASDLGL